MVGFYPLNKGLCLKHDFIEKKSKKGGTPDRTRTCNIQFRKLTLYPIELRAQPARGLCALDSSGFQGYYSPKQKTPLATKPTG